MSAALAIPSTVSATEFLTQLFQPLDAGYIHLFAIDRTSGSRETRWAPVGDIPKLLTSATPLLLTSCIWFGPATRDRELGTQRGGSGDCTAISAVWVDIDCISPNHASTELPPTREAALELLELYPVRPSAIVDTGGGIQAWWFLEEALPRSDAEPFLARWGTTWAELGRRKKWHVDNVFDLARIMRLPATWNRKNEPTRVVVTDWHPHWRTTIAELDQWTIEAPPAPPNINKRHDVPYIGPERPGDAFNLSTDPADLLDGAGFIFDHQDRGSGDRHYRAPHRAGERGSTGATVYADGHTTIWSETFANAHGMKVKRPYDPFGLFTHIKHGGDWRSATTMLADIGYGSQALSFTHDETRVMFGVDTATGEIAATKTHLPETFWDQRPVLHQIRQAARSRLVSPAAVLGCVLARIAAYTPPSSCLPPTIGTSAPLSLYVALQGRSGAGKSSPVGTAADLIPHTPPGCVGPLALGSGEGLVEAFMDLVEETDGQGKKRKVKKQVHHGALFSLDEGQALAEIGSRKGSTILPVLRTAWSGGDPGQANASIETRRSLRPGSYAVGLISAWQDKSAGTLIADEDGGTPQRFVWLPTSDPGATLDDPGWPGSINWQPPAMIGMSGIVGHRYLEIHPDIHHEIRSTRVSVLKDEGDDVPLDAHRRLNKLKIAGLLAILDNRHNIDLDDWDIAEQILTASDTVRDRVISHIKRQASEAEFASYDKTVTRESLSERATRKRSLDKAAKCVAKRILKGDGAPVPLRDLRHAIASRDRQNVTLDEVLDELVNLKWGVQTDLGWIPGQARPR